MSTAADRLCRSYNPQSQTQSETWVDSVDRIMERSSCPQPPKFDAAFLERRMQAHREWAAQETAELATGIILEVKIALEAYDVAD